jgi:hypothetical protein
MYIAKATAKAQVFGTKNAWSLSPIHQGKDDGQECVVAVEIQGDDKYGYHLVLAPEGFFAGNSWHESVRDAMDEALELLGVDQDQWSVESIS